MSAWDRSPWDTSRSLWETGQRGLSHLGSSTSTATATTTTTRDGSISRDRSQQAQTSQDGDAEPKSGSGSLVDGSFSLEGRSFRYASNWNTVSGRSMSQVGPVNQPSSQNRSMSSSASAQTASGASQGLSTLSRPPTISLNSTTNSYQRHYGNAFSNGLSSKDPPPVYTKFDRPAEPTKKVDSVDSALDRNGSISSWVTSNTTPSPTEGRHSQAYTNFSAQSSVPSSRERSNPPSRHSNDPPFFSFQPRSQLPTAPNTRASSIAVPGSGMANGYSHLDFDDVGQRLSQLNLNGNSRPPTSYKQAANGNSFKPFSPSTPTGMYNTSSARATVPELDDVQEIERPGLHYPGFDAFPPQQSALMNCGRPSANTRFSQSSGGGMDPRNAQPFTPGVFQPRANELANGFRQPQDWQGYPNGGALALDRRPSNEPLDQHYLDPRIQQLIVNQIRNSPYAPPMYNPYAIQGGIQLPPTYLPLLPMQIAGVDPKMPVDMPSGDGVQSALMYEFKSNTKTKRYELKDIYDHIAEFSGDQHGSRFIQTKLETANSDEKERVFREIEPNAIPLMTDVFGNYVIQKFFEHGDQTHKKILANKMRGQVLNLSLQMYGCRVVQKALDHVLVDQQAMLISELESHVLKCVKDQNGNHVIQKAIERCPPHTSQFITNAFRGQVMSLSIHPYGCRVIQRCLERCDMPSKERILDELMEPQSIPSMISDQYGNYVVQHIVSKDDGRGKHRVLAIVLNGLEGFSKHKFASNVVEKCLEQADDVWRRHVVWKLEELNRRRVEGEGVLVTMIKDNFGNYVIQKLLDTLGQQDFKLFYDILYPAMLQAKKTGCGKQVQSIEKKMHRFPPPPPGPPFGGAGTYHSYNAHQLSVHPPTFGSHYGSAANTPPPLTADNSTIPSINGDAVEGADRSRKSSEPSSDGRYSR